MYKKSNACHCNQLNMPWFLLDHVKEAFILTNPCKPLVGSPHILLPEEKAQSSGETANYF